MAQPASQVEISPAATQVKTLAAPIPAGSGNNATSAGGSSAAGSASPAPAIVPTIAAPDYPPPAVREPAPPAKPALVLLSILPSDALVYHPQGSSFESLAAQTLDNAGTSDDGFDDLINPVLAAFGEDQPALASLGAGLSDADFITGDFAAGVFSPVTADIADLVSSGDAALNDTAAAFGDTPAPTPVPVVPGPPDVGTPVDGGLNDGGGIDGLLLPWDTTHGPEPLPNIGFGG